MALFSSVKLETSGGRTIEYRDHFHPNLLMYKLLTSTDDEYESGFVKNQGIRDRQLKSDHAAAQIGHMYMMVRMSDLFGLVNALEKIIYGLGFKLIFKKNNNDRALFRGNAGADAVSNDGNTEIRGISWCVLSIDPSNDNRIIKKKGLIKRILLTSNFKKERHFIRMCPVLLISYSILEWKVVWKDHNT